MSTSKGRIARAHSAIFQEAETPPFAGALDLACRDADPEIFFAVDTPTADLARAVCHTCPREDECLAWALETDQRHGTWGGKTRAQRDSMLRARRKPGPAVHLIRDDQAVTSCCGRTPAELPHAEGHRLTADRRKATCLALVPRESTDEHLELP